MSNTSPLSEPARWIVVALVQQPGEQMSRAQLLDHTGLTDSELLALRHELLTKGWIEHPADANSPSEDLWKLLSAKQREVARLPSLQTMPDGSVVLRPASARGLAWAVGCTGGLCAFLLWGVFAWRWTWAILVLLLLGSAFLGMLLSLLNSWAQVTRLTPTSLLLRTRYGRTRSIPRGAIARATFIKVDGMRVSPEYLLFLNEQGHCLGRLFPLNIPGDQVRAFVRQLGVPFTDERQQARSIQQVRREFPGSIAWAMQPVVLALIIVGVLILGIIVVILILVATGALQPVPGP